MVGGPGPGDRAVGQTVKLCTGGELRREKMVDGDAVARLELGRASDIAGGCAVWSREKRTRNGRDGRGQ